MVDELRKTYLLGLRSEPDSERRGQPRVPAVDDVSTSFGRDSWNRRGAARRRRAVCVIWLNPTPAVKFPRRYRCALGLPKSTMSSAGCREMRVPGPPCITESQTQSRTGDSPKQGRVHETRSVGRRPGSCRNSSSLWSAIEHRGQASARQWRAAQACRHSPGTRRGA